MRSIVPFFSALTLLVASTLVPGCVVEQGEIDDPTEQLTTEEVDENGEPVLPLLALFLVGTEITAAQATVSAGFALMAGYVWYQGRKYWVKSKPDAAYGLSYTADKSYFKSATQATTVAPPPPPPKCKDSQFRSESAAAASIGGVAENIKPSTGGPCPGIGTHAVAKTRSGSYLGTISCCPCVKTSGAASKNCWVIY